MEADLDRQWATGEESLELQLHIKCGTSSGSSCANLTTQRSKYRKTAYYGRWIILK